MLADGYRVPALPYRRRRTDCSQLGGGGPGPPDMLPARPTYKPQVKLRRLRPVSDPERAYRSVQSVASRFALIVEKRLVTFRCTADATPPTPVRTPAALLSQSS